MIAVSTPATISESVAKQLKGGRVDVAGRVFTTLLLIALGLSMLTLVVLIVDVVVTGWDVLSGGIGGFLTGSLSADASEAGLSQALRGTFFIGLFTIIISFPLGVAAAIHLEEYAHHGLMTRIIDLTIRNLAGVPSVVYGILGLTIFVKALDNVTGAEANGRTVISAGLTLAILVLPIVIITSAEALRAVPNGIREAGFGVGATRWEVVRYHVIPYAAPGILTGTVLALARALGEAAPLILVGATTGFLSGGESYAISGLQERFTAMPIVITNWAGRPAGQGWEAATAAAIVVLLIVVLFANTTAILLRNRYEKKRSA